MLVNKRLKAILPKLKKFLCPELIKEIQVADDDRLVLYLPFRFSPEYVEELRDEFLERMNQNWLDFKAMEREAYQKGDYHEILTWLGEPYRIKFVASVSHLASKEMLTELFLRAWLGNRVGYKNEHIKKIMKNLTQDDFLKKNTEEEKEVFNALPEIVDIYRGYNNKLQNVCGWSWSLSREIAYRFTWHIVYKEKGNVIRYRIPKKSLMLYTNEMGEHEVLVNPSDIKWDNIEIVMKNVRFEGVSGMEELPDIPAESFLKKKDK